MNEQRIIEINLELALDAAWQEFLKGIPMHGPDINRLAKLCFAAGFMQGAKFAHTSKELSKKVQP